MLVRAEGPTAVEEQAVLRIVWDLPEASDLSDDIVRASVDGASGRDAGGCLRRAVLTVSGRPTAPGARGFRPLGRTNGDLLMNAGGPVVIVPFESAAERPTVAPSLVARTAADDAAGRSGRRGCRHREPRSSRQARAARRLAVRRVVHTGAVIAEHALTWSPRHPTDLLQTIGALRRGGGDPTYHRDERGAVWRTTRTDEGVATLRYTQPASDELRCEGWGPGARAGVAGHPSCSANATTRAGSIPASGCSTTRTDATRGCASRAPAGSSRPSRRRSSSRR